MKLDLSPFENALVSLNEAIKKSYEDESDKFIRDSVIQRFEYTYEVSYKMLRRFLQLSEHSEGSFDEFVFADVIRTANERNLLLGNLESWVEYRKMRNITSHSYDEEKANVIISVVPSFAKEAEFLLNKLKEKSKNL
ncbi:MAG: nucleotidyltransferase substrate binding protein [Endomicrobium sp.]|jgi:nucleotidyltransferase substrate binding protein (TIGR01987 family)|nr:nucleotidyltransferase substrate binding protein [Endomicrobium sp.]